jgi:transcriptional regulator with XRE-family HTH domain
MSSQPIFDREVFGRLLRAARIIAGYDRVEDAAAAVHDQTGVDISARTIYALERGEQEPTASQFLALAVTLRPPSGETYWASAMRPDVLAYYAEENRRGTH